MGDPIWKGLFEWSMKYQDGTRDTEGPKQLSEADKQWLDEAIKANTIDLGARMKEIKSKLDGSGIAGNETVTSSALTTKDKEHLLDELMEIVEHIDHARDLQSIGGLPTLMILLEDAEPILRSKAAEIVATCAQNNPPVQQWMMDGGVFPKLFALLSDCDSRVRVKALLALSCVVRENNNTLARFRALGGVPQLVGLLYGDDAPRLHRKVLQLLRYVFREEPQDVVACMDKRMLGVLTAMIDRAVPTATANSSMCNREAPDCAAVGEAADMAEASLALLQQAACVKEVHASLAKDATLHVSLAALQQRLTARDQDQDDLQQRLNSLQLQLQPDAPVTTSQRENSIVLVKKKP